MAKKPVVLEADLIFPSYKVNPVSELVPYARNARTHSKEQIQQIADSISEFGFTNPVLVDEVGGIIAGHGRVLAAQLIGLTTVPCIELLRLSQEQKQAYIIADNKLALNAGWDVDTLKSELIALKECDFDLALTGFSLDELNGLLGGFSGLTDPDEVPETPVDPVSVLGDVWALGSHRIVCGDSTDADDVAKALNGVQPHLMVTDPPYGVEYDASWRVEAGLNNDTSAQGKVKNDDRADWREAWVLFPGDVAYVWHGSLHVAEVAESLRAAKFALRSHIVWVKTRPVISRGQYHWQHEPALYVEKEEDGSAIPDMVFDHVSAAYAVRLGKTGSWNGGRRQSTVWFIEHLKSATGHSTQKPVECMRRPLLNNSSVGQAVYDPFLGSGTTLIACEMEGRACHGLELNSAYCDVIIKRWQDFTGKTAVHAETGLPFNEVKNV